MKKAYIHIGLEKTGTTAIQVFLAANELVLQSNGFTYLCDRNASYFVWNAHFPVAACNFTSCPDFIPSEKFMPKETVLGDLRKDVEACDQHVIISCEHFSSRLTEREPLVAIRDALASREIKIVCYLRRQDELSLSAYSTFVKCGRYAPFQPDDVNPDNRYFNFHEVLKLWGSVFGFENIVVKNYNKHALAGGNICRDFLHVIGIPDMGFRTVHEQNLSLDERRVEILRRVNAHLAQFDPNCDREEFKTSMEVRRALMPLLPTGAPISCLLSVSDRTTIMRRFDESNRWVAKNFRDAEFLLDWQTVRSDTPEKSGVSIEDYARALAECGKSILYLEKEVSRLKTSQASQTDQLPSKDKNATDSDHPLQNDAPPPEIKGFYEKMDYAAHYLVSKIPFLPKALRERFARAAARRRESV